MKHNRLFGIIYHLLNNKKTTARELAETFEVSPRTIYRDIDVLSQLGLPVYTELGRKGGIQLLDNFALDKVLLSKEEQSNLLFALQGIKTMTPEISEQSLSKLQSLFQIPFDHWLEVDFSRWHQTSTNDEKFVQIKTAIVNQTQLTFAYVGRNGSLARRCCEPLKLLFKSQTWYLQAFCVDRNAFRVFKINRMSDLRMNGQTFHARILPEIGSNDGNQALIALVLSFSEQILYRVFDEFDHQEIAMQKDGRALVHTTMPNQDWLIRYVLSFGRHVKVLSPDSIRQSVQQELEEIAKNI